jgi:hypothetical protein
MNNKRKMKKKRKDDLKKKKENLRKNNQTEILEIKSSLNLFPGNKKMYVK